jgi:hypothetical protein
MKKLFILNGLILSGLSLSAQNWINNNDNNVYASNVQSTNYNTTLTNVSVQTNVGNSNSQLTNVYGSNVQLSTTQLTGNSGGSTTNKPKQKKIIQVQQVNTNPTVNDNNGNLYENNVGNLTNPDANRGNGGNINTNKNVSINSNPQVNTTTTKTVVMEEFKGTDFKPIGLSGRDYSNGGKMKKGVKNFPKADNTKVKHKRKPGFKKVKYHTSKCANW